MQTVTATAMMQKRALRWRRQGLPVALVPTMGFLHPGHLSLIERARREAGRRGLVVVSIYVNPTQFGPREDFNRYPRDLKRDLRLCRQAGADFVFAPSNAEMYAGGGSGEESSTSVVEESVTIGMEGDSRPTHFRGVATVVAKLFHLVLPTVAVFGEKDYQQAALIRRMVRDLFFPLEVLVAPTRREPDGLAMSSRNVYLSETQRREAAVLFRALERTRARVADRPVSAPKLKSQVKAFIEGTTSGRLDYAEFFDSETLRPVRMVRPGARMALAVFFGKTRLIDNGPL
ncbi:MAG: pantoate--beta-alanine ligase [Verrucomicrobia bacterium]|nr:pantoate--beta-alanine ligase [Verrucomicrobiota bacterium]